jgi:leucyl aminopeptidase (aminopeptidase T)
MPTRYVVKCLVVFLALGVSLVSQARAAEKRDLKAIAERIVAECAGVHEGDLVLVTGDVRDMDLVEDLSIASARHGAAPMQLVERERAGVRYFTEVPEKYDGTRATFALQMAAIPSVFLSVNSNAEPGLYRAVPASRLQTAARSFRAFGETLMKRGVRQVYIGNGLYPTAATARILGLSQAGLEKIFWARWQPIRS